MQKKTCFLILCLSTAIMAEVPTYTTMPIPISTTSPNVLVSTPTPLPTSPAIPCSDPKDLEIFRCSCRAQLTISGGGVSSDPLLIGSGYVIYSQTDLSGTACQGTFRPDVCRPALNGQIGFGRYTCATVTINGNEVTIK